MIMKIRNVNIDEIVTSFSYTKSIKIKKKKGIGKCKHCLSG